MTTYLHKDFWNLSDETFSVYKCQNEQPCPWKSLKNFVKNSLLSLEESYFSNLDYGETWIEGFESQSSGRLLFYNRINGTIVFSTNENLVFNNGVFL